MEGNAPHKVFLAFIQLESDTVELISWLPLLVGLLFWLWTSAWAYHDAKSRGKPPLLVYARLAYWLARKFGGLDRIEAGKDSPAV